MKDSKVKKIITEAVLGFLNEKPKKLKSNKKEVKSLSEIDEIYKELSKDN